jgi:hypothetical protein
MLVIAFVSLAGMGASQSPSPAPQTPPAATELEYETYCKKEEREKRRLFRAATPSQKSLLARTQIERWREANRARLSKEQVAALQELWTMATAEIFDGSQEGKSRLAAFEARADSVFSGTEMDQISPYGPCVPKPPGTREP